MLPKKKFLIPQLPFSNSINVAMFVSGIPCTVGGCGEHIFSLSQVKVCMSAWGHVVNLIPYFHQEQASSNFFFAFSFLPFKIYFTNDFCLQVESLNSFLLHPLAFRMLLQTGKV